LQKHLHYIDLYHFIVNRYCKHIRNNTALHAGMPETYGIKSWLDLVFLMPPFSFVIPSELRR
jgi:hypothetical protein